MPDFNDPELQQRYESYLTIHLKKEERDLPLRQKLQAIDRRDRNKWLQLAVNLAAMLLFGYSFYYDITQLSNTFFVIITAVFLINVGLIFYQKKQLSEVKQYLEWKGGAAPQEGQTASAAERE